MRSFRSSGVRAPLPQACPAAAACIGLGIPVGVIGPTLVIGAACGGILFHLTLAIAPESTASLAFYVMLGMATVLAATLRAPLVVVVLELTMDAGVILPAMVASRRSISGARQRGPRWWTAS